MKKLYYILLSFLSVFLIGCTDKLEGDSMSSSEDGNVHITISSSEMPLIVTRSGDEQDVIENVVLFVFDNSKGENKGKLVKKMYQYFDSETITMSMFLLRGDYNFCAVCNLHDPDAIYNAVNTYDELKKMKVEIENAADAYRGNFVMYGEQPITIDGSGSNNNSISVDRLASFWDLSIMFTPDNADETLEITEVKMVNIPRGSWIVPQSNPDSDENGMEGDKGDWVYSEYATDAQNKYFASDKVELEHMDLSEEERAKNIKWKYAGAYYMFENRRGAVPVSGTHPYEYNDTYWPGSQALASAAEAAGKQSVEYSYLDVLRQSYKNPFADSEKSLPEREKLQAYFANASYLVISGIYQEAASGEGVEPPTYMVSYTIYLGEDNFKDYNVKRNHKYRTIINIRSKNEIDTRINSESLGKITLSAPNEELDAHCNTMTAVLYAPDEWEVWVVDPDKTPWLEISLNPQYRGRTQGVSFDQDKFASYKLSGKNSTLKNIYIHTDEFIPDLKNPNENDPNLRREGKIAYRSLNYPDEIFYHTVVQRPAQMAVLHINYDVHTMKEVRDTFYIERMLERRNMEWGFKNYWCLTIDDLIASGRWDGLSNTRKLYQVAVNGDKYSDPKGPAYPDGISNDVALGYILEKNRDRDGDGKIGYDEIMWYLPALKELQCLREALDDRTISFEGATDVFQTSTPSSADPHGITTGFSYFVKMSNGKLGIGQRDRKYNVIALRRKNNEWSGPNAGDGKFTISIETGWKEEELVMPKNSY